MYNEMFEKLKSFNQEHLLNFWLELSSKQKKKLTDQLKQIDWAKIDKLIESNVFNTPGNRLPDDLKPAPFFKLIPGDDERQNLYLEAMEKGQKLISSNKIAAFTVAGGQGTRLGFSGPKGTYSITPIKEKSLFQYFAESIKRASEKYAGSIPWYIMTSDMNDQVTRSFFEKNAYFGLPSNSVMFFRQGTMPVIGNDGKLLLDEKDSLALAPDGHGGSFLALKHSGALNDMLKKGVEYISYFQVDNPLVSVVNPLLIGLHCLEQSEMSSIMISKTGPFEKLGNFCVSNGRLLIIEYSDMPTELSEKRDALGNLCFVAGSPAIHVISRKFIERLTQNGISLPWHRAEKKVSYIDKTGRKVKPAVVNAVKLETFIFDALSLADKTIILEAAREKEFAPTKNKAGVDSVESCREMLIARDANRLEQFAGIKIPRKANGEPDCVVELSPSKYLDDEDVELAAKSFANDVQPLKGNRIYYG